MTTHILSILESQLDVSIVVVLIVVVLVMIVVVLVMVVFVLVSDRIPVAEASGHVSPRERILEISSPDGGSSSVLGRRGLVVVLGDAVSGLGPGPDRALVPREGRRYRWLKVRRLGWVWEVSFNGRVPWVGRGEDALPRSTPARPSLAARGEPSARSSSHARS